MIFSVSSVPSVVKLFRPWAGRPGHGGLSCRPVERSVLYLIAAELGSADEASVGPLAAGVDLHVEVIPTVAGGVRAAALRRWREGRAGLVIAHGRNALPAAAVGGGRVLYLPDDRDADESGSVRWVGTGWNGLPVGELHVAVPSRALAERYVRMGVPRENCHVVRPPAKAGGVGEFLGIEDGNRDEARRALGLAPDAFALYAPGPATRAGRQEVAVWAAGLLRELDGRVRLLLEPHGPRAGAVRRFARRMARADLLIDCPRPAIAEAAADAALVASTAPANPVPMLRAAAAGLPIVASAGAVAAEFLRDGETALVAADASARALARRAIDFREGRRAVGRVKVRDGTTWEGLLERLLS